MSTTKLFGNGLVLILLIALVLTYQNQTPKAPVSNNPNAIRYLPLGDSYTIGESVAEADRWPNQLVRRLAQNGKQLEIVANSSVTGYTTQNLIDRELPLVQELKPDFVTILIGVNDYVQGVDAATFEQRLDYIISTTQKQLAKPGNIALVTIPDYGKTPSGSQYGSPGSSEAGIKAFNTIIAQAGIKYNLPVADIFTAS
ncbi:MAG TPA: SGNH/GDSL hydrolase family protein [Candidatus Limnocylindrales bacterium]|nr:SGNH/GDSL hydrolase family protein [Candidatus Limnocylindrales bacterium]